MNKEDFIALLGQKHVSRITMNLGLCKQEKRIPIADKANSRSKAILCLCNGSLSIVETSIMMTFHVILKTILKQLFVLHDCWYYMNAKTSKTLHQYCYDRKCNWWEMISMQKLACQIIPIMDVETSLAIEKINNFPSRVCCLVF